MIRFARLVEGGACVRLPIGERLCERVTDGASARVAEERLLAELRASTAASDGPLARWDRFASQWLSRRLVLAVFKESKAAGAIVWTRGDGPADRAAHRGWNRRR